MLLLFFGQPEIAPPVVVPDTANQWYGYLKSYERLNKPKRKYKEEEITLPPKTVEVIQEVLTEKPLLAQQLLAALRVKAQRDGTQATHAFIDRIKNQRSVALAVIEMQRLADEADEEDALMLLM